MSPVPPAAPPLDPAAVGRYAPTAGTPDPTAGAHADDARCPTCGAARPERFCPRCGERRVDADDYALRHFAAHAVDQVFNLDGTLWRTLRTLVTRPGLLTAEYLAGRRTRHTRPLQLFLLVNVAFFLAMNAVHSFRFPLAQYAHGRVGSYALRDTTTVQTLVAAKARRRGISAAEFERRFDAASGAQQSVWLLTAPLFAGALAVLYARRRRPYVHHLVFAVHFFAFLLLLLTGIVGALSAAWAAVRALIPAAPALGRALAPALQVVSNERVWGPAALVAVGVYLFTALRRVYPEPWPWTLGRAALLAAAVPPLTNVYRDLLFAVAYLSV